MERGIYVVGQLLGFEQTPWSGQPDKFNFYVGIVVDGMNVQKIEIMPNDAANVSELCKKHLGQVVRLRARFQLIPTKKGGNWLKVSAPEGSTLEVIADAVKRAA